jgi:Flp pilus assembly protein TadD
MHRKSLAINEELGRKEGMAANYGNLGVSYQTRGDLDQAEAMLRKALAIEEELGHKAGMASQYGNLGLI